MWTSQEDCYVHTLKVNSSVSHPSLSILTVSSSEHGLSLTWGQCALIQSDLPRSKFRINNKHKQVH